MANWRAIYPKHAAHAANADAMFKLGRLSKLTYKEVSELYYLLKPRCANGHEYGHSEDDENNKKFIG